MAGCAGQKHLNQDNKDPFFDKWKAKAETSKGHSPSSQKRIIDLKEKKAVAAVLEEAVTAEKTLPAQEIDLSMHGVDVSVLLRTLGPRCQYKYHDQ